MRHGDGLDGGGDLGLGLGGTASGGVRDGGVEVTEHVLEHEALPHGSVRFRLVANRQAVLRGLRRDFPVLTPSRR